MKFFEFGKEHKKLMVMLHGGGACREAAEEIPCKDYRKDLQGSEKHFFNKNKQ